LVKSALDKANKAAKPKITIEVLILQKCFRLYMIYECLIKFIYL
jgi:hypothetical protein